MIDIWEEIWASLSKNKFRTFLTGFAIAWGIFMLILLLGAGNGLKNGTAENFSGMAVNKITAWPGQTSQPYQGMQKGRRVKFEAGDTADLRREILPIDALTPTIDIWNTTVSHGKEYVTATLSGVKPVYTELWQFIFKPGNGRFINEIDMKENRKVIVIHERTAKILFPHEKALGKQIICDKVSYQVVGIYNDDDLDTSPDVYIPLTTAQIIYNPTNGYNSLQMTIKGVTTAQEGEALSTLFREKMGKKHQFSPTDYNAVYIWNMLENYLQGLGIFNGITVFIWIIGIGTLIAGIVGVSNIMLITVKERTREFGIRKALGASPLSILSLVVTESILITAFFGYIGMVAGIGVTEGVANILAQNAANPEDGIIFSNPTVDLPVVISATILLITAGVLAGYFPARKAVKIKPIEALRSE